MWDILKKLWFYSFQNVYLFGTPAYHLAGVKLLQGVCVCRLDFRLREICLFGTYMQGFDSSCGRVKIFYWAEQQATTQ